MLSALRHVRVPPKSIVLCVDFDETITLQDTISLLFQHATSSASMQQQLVTHYTHELSTFLQHYETQWQPSRNFDRAGLRSFMEGYAAVDLRSLQRVQECRALCGIRHQDIDRAARTVKLQPNCVETLAATEWKIISANWSAELVRSVMRHAGITEKQVIANELKRVEGVTTGEIEVKVQSPMDKERWIGKVRAMHVETQPTVVYVGDSANDLLALLEADVGIWFNPGTATSSDIVILKLMQRLVECYGIDVYPLMNYKSLTDCVIKASDAGNDRPVVFTTTDWSQVKAIFQEGLED